jgi:hypothetical protein
MSDKKSHLATIVLLRNMLLVIVLLVKNGLSGKQNMIESSRRIIKNRGSLKTLLDTINKLISSLRKGTNGGREDATSEEVYTW